MTHREADHGRTACRQELMVFDQTAVLAQPRKRALHHPAVRLNRKALHVFLVFSLPHDLQRPAAGRSRPVHQFAAICGISPNQRQARKCAQTVAKHLFGSGPILHVARLNRDSEQKPLRIYEQVPSSAFDLLIGIVADAA